MSTFKELITKSDKQKAMSAAWEANGATLKTAKDQAKTARDTAKDQAKTARDTAKKEADELKKAATEERRVALHEKPQNPEKVKAADDKIAQADKVKEQAETAYKTAIKEADKAYDAAVNKAGADYDATHDELIKDQKAHNNDSWDRAFSQNMSLAEMRAEDDSTLNNTNNAGASESGSEGTANASSEGSDNTSAGESGSDNVSSEGTDNASADESGSDNTGSEGSEGGGMKGIIKGAYDKAKKDLKGKNQGIRFSDSFYRDIGATVRGQRTGNLYDAEAETAQEQAQNYRNRAATNQMEAQRSQQIANQNPYAEAGKMASVQNDTENRQNVQKAGVLGAGAALARKTNTPDVQSQIAREDQQQNVANQRRDEANTAQEESTAAEGDVKNYQIKSRDHNVDRNEASDLSLGKDTTAQAESETQATEEQETQATDEQAAEEQAAEEQTTEEQTTEEQTNDQPEQTPEQFNATWQNVLNYLTYGNDQTSNWSKPGGKDGGAAQKYAEAMGWQPLTETDVANTSNGFNSSQGELQDIISKARPEFMQAWRERSGRVKDGKQINAGDVGYDEAAKTNTEMTTNPPPSNPPSDARVKDIKSCLSDLRMKYIKEDFDRFGRCAPHDFMWLLEKAGNLKYNNKEYNALGADDFSSDNTILEAYRDHIKNYVYNYKPEAVNIDPRIDPNEEHIGPMAQDIEQVNPACIKETAEGVKTVDTARLAMMNAGAIGDLARQLDELNKKFQALGL